MQDREEIIDPSWPPETCLHLRQARRRITFAQPDAPPKFECGEHICRDPDQQDHPALDPDAADQEKCKARGKDCCWRPR